MNARKGFSLVEMAIVLVIVGLLLGLGTALIGPLTERAQLSQTRDITRTAYESLLGFVASNKRLPATLAELGISSTDPYGRQLVYQRPDALTVTGVNICTTSAPFLTINDSSSGALQARNNVAFLLFSEGRNRANNTGAASPYTINVPGANDYDDVVLFADIDRLRNQICTSFRVTTEALPLGTEEVAYPASTLEATDGTLPYNWSVTAGALPPGLTLAAGGAISGTATSDGSYNFTVQARDSDALNRMAAKSLSITINPNKPRVTTDLLAYGIVGQAFPATTLGATGGLAPYSWSLAAGSSLPTGLSMNAAGVISGTPTAAGTFSFTITVRDSRARTAGKTLSLAINPSGGSTSSCATFSLNPTAGSSFSATVGASFSRTITVGGGQAPYSSTQCAPASCNGLTLSCNATGATISGTPNSAGTCTFNLSWQDSCTTPGAQTVGGAYVVAISAPPCTPFSGWNSSLPTATNCSAYTGSASVFGGVSPLTWTRTGGQLPTGLSFCTANTSGTCNIVGTTLAMPGTYSFSAQVSDSCTSGAQSTNSAFFITVTDNCTSGTVSLRNSTGQRRWYKRNNGACTQWNNNNNLTVGLVDAITVFTDSSCSVQCASTNYCNQKSFDSDQDCQTRLNWPCDFADR